MSFKYTMNAGLIGPGLTTSKVGVFDINYSTYINDSLYGNIFTIYTPTAGDSYTLSNTLGSGQTGTTAKSIDSGFVKINVNGNGRGVLGTGSNGTTSSTVYQVLYAINGGSAYTYGDFNDDPFQPGTPHEAGFFYIDGGAATIGGFNDSATSNSFNGTTYIWQLGDNTIVVLLGTTTYGHVVMQYQILPSSPRIVRMHMSYTNTTASNRTVLAQRGGDCDFNNYTTNNFRGYGSYPTTDYVYSSGQSNGKTVGVFCPGNGYTHNCVISSAFTDQNPNNVLNNVSDASGSSGDKAIYCAWNFGTVTPGQTVWGNCYYLFGPDAAGAANLIY